MYCLRNQAKLRYQLYVEKKATTDMKNMVDYGMAIQKK